MDYERKTISRHEALVFEALRSRPDAWFTNQDLATALSEEGVSERTVRFHTRRLAGLGVIDMAVLFPAYEYRWAEDGFRRNPGYAQRLRQAGQILRRSRG